MSKDSNKGDELFETPPHRRKEICHSRFKSLMAVTQRQMDIEGNGEKILAVRLHTPFLERTLTKHRIKGDFFLVRQTMIEDKEGSRLFALIGKGKETDADRRRSRLQRLELAEKHKAIAKQARENFITVSINADK